MSFFVELATELACIVEFVCVVWLFFIIRKKDKTNKLLLFDVSRANLIATRANARLLVHGLAPIWGDVVQK